MAAHVPNFSVMSWFLLGTMRLAVMQQRLAKILRGGDAVADGAFAI